MRSELPLLGTSHQQEPRNFKYRYLGFLIDVDTERTECFHTFFPQEVTAMYFHFSSWKIYHKHISANLNSAHVLFINFKLFNFLKFPFIILELKFVTGIAIYSKIISNTAFKFWHNAAISGEGITSVPVLNEVLYMQVKWKINNIK